MQCRLIVHEMVFSPVFIDTKMDEVSETENQYAQCRHITGTPFVPRVCSVEQAAELQYQVSVSPQPP